MCGGYRGNLEDSILLSNTIARKTRTLRISSIHVTLCEAVGNPESTATDTPKRVAEAHHVPFGVAVAGVCTILVGVWLAVVRVALLLHKALGQTVRLSTGEAETSPFTFFGRFESNRAARCIVGLLLFWGLHSRGRCSLTDWTD